MKIKEKDRLLEILKKVDLKKSPLYLDKNNFKFFASDIAKDLVANFSEMTMHPDLKWCMSTIKKVKVFLCIYQANELGRPSYKEEIAKNLNEYSYKSVAVIIDEGISRGIYIPLKPSASEVGDKKVKNIRPSVDLMASFYNWNMSRIASLNSIVKKYSKS